MNNKIDNLIEIFDDVYEMLKAITLTQISQCTICKHENNCKEFKLYTTEALKVDGLRDILLKMERENADKPKHDGCVKRTPLYEDDV